MAERTFADEAHTTAQEMAREMVARGEDTSSGAVVVVDPRDEFGGQAAVATFVMRGDSEQEANRKLAEKLAEAGRRSGSPWSSRSTMPPL